MATTELTANDLDASDNKFAITELMVFFRKLRISPKDARVYAQRLVDQGYDDVQALCEDVNEADLKEIGMRPGHIKRVTRSLSTTDWTAYSVGNDEQSDYDSAVSPAPSRVNSSADVMSLIQPTSQPPTPASRRPAATILPSDPSDWTYYDTIQWLSQFEELRQERYFAMFEQLRVDGTTLLRLQTPSEIDRLEIPIGPARERFVKELLKLQRQREPCSSSDAQEVSSRKTRSNLGTITEDEEASDEEARPDPILTHVPSFYFRQGAAPDESDFYSSAVGDLSGVSDNEEVRRNLQAAILETRDVPRRRSSLNSKSQDSDHSKRSSSNRAHRQTVSDDDSYAEPKRSVSAVQHRPKSQHEAQPSRPTHRREKSTSAPPSAYVEPLSGGGAASSGGEAEVGTTRRARRPSKKLKSAKSVRRLSLTSALNHGGGMSTDNGSGDDDEEEDVKTLLVANNSDADGLSGVDADVDAELSLLSSHHPTSKMAKAFKPSLRVVTANLDPSRSSPVTPHDKTLRGGSIASPNDLSPQEGQGSSYQRLLRAASSERSTPYQKLKRPKSLMQFAPGGQLHLQLGSSAKSQSLHFTEQGTFQAGGFQLGPNGMIGVPESLRNTMSPSSSPIATPKYTREATILLEELGRGACGTVQKGIYVPALTMVAVKFVQVHDDDRRRQMVRELKAFYSMSVSSFEDDDDPEYAPNASSASLLSQTSESSTLLGRLSDGAGRQPLDEVSQNPEVITTQEPAKRKRVKRRSPHIVNFYDAYTDPDRGAVAIVLEYMNAGSLQDLIHNNVRPDEEMIATIAYSVLHGLYAIHTRQIIHRDVKPGNILLTRDGHVKLSDFGVMRELVDTINARTFTGTMYYMSPERIRGEKYSFQSDIWSLGVSLITLATGKIPFPTDSGYWGLIGAIQDGPPPSLPEDMIFSVDLRDFVNDCVKLDQQERPTADILLNHPFLIKTLNLEPGSLNQYPPIHVPRLKLPASFMQTPPRNVDQIIDSVLEWQMEHLLDEEYFPSLEPGRRHSISNAGEREHKDMLMQKLTLIQYAPRQINRLANQMWVSPDILQQAFATRWEVAEEQLRSNELQSLLFFPQPPFTTQQLRQRAWMEERAQFSDSASSAYGTPRAAHSAHGEHVSARRRSALSRRASLVQAGYNSASGRGSDLDTNELLPSRAHGAHHAIAPTASAAATPERRNSSSNTGSHSPCLEIRTTPHIPKDEAPSPTPNSSAAASSPSTRQLQQLKAFFQTQPPGIISPISTESHSLGHKGLERRRASSRSLTDLDDMETEAPTPRMIEKPISPLLLAHLRRPSTGTRTGSDNVESIMDPLLGKDALTLAEAKGPQLSLLPTGGFPSSQELLRPKSGDGCPRPEHGAERKGMHQRSRSRGYASHVRNLSSSTNSSTTTSEKYRPTRSKARSRRRSLPDEVYATVMMPSMGSITTAQARILSQTARRNTICAVPPADASAVSVYGPVSDDDIGAENFQWSVPTSATTRPHSAVSPYDDTADHDTALSKEALVALEMDAAVNDFIGS